MEEVKLACLTLTVASSGVEMISFFLPRPPKLDDMDVQTLKDSITAKDFYKISHLVFAPKSCFLGLTMKDCGKGFQRLWQMVESIYAFYNWYSGEEIKKTLQFSLIIGVYIYNMIEANKLQEKIRKIIKHLKMSSGGEHL